MPVLDDKPILVVLAMTPTRPNPSFDTTFEYLRMFNHVVVSDEEFAARLPETEFELSFSHEGDIYVNGKPLEVNEGALRSFGAELSVDAMWNHIGSDEP